MADCDKLCLGLGESLSKRSRLGDFFKALLTLDYL